MKNPGSLPRISSQSRLLNLLETEFHDAEQAYELFRDFLHYSTYNHSFCLRLLTLAKQRIGAPWDIRRLAILMLEHQILKLHPDRLDDFESLFTQLGLKEAPGLDSGVVSSVLKEGYSATGLRPFIGEFRRKLERLNHVHSKIRGRRTTDSALRDFIGLSRRDCRLSLARYLFTPDEVVDEILSHLQVTDGVRDLDTSEPRFVQDSMTHAVNCLPDFEAGILKRLCASANIYWVSESTSSEINSLVEYPITTVVLVIKPPGSDIEFEIKRAGRRRRNPLSVVYASDGYTVPPSHRLDGGSMQWLLRFEAKAASRFATVYRLVHGTDAPMSNYISRSTVYSIPVRNAQVQTLSYFTDSQVFGEGFREMRVAMAESANAFDAENTKTLPALPGDLGLTAHFIGHVTPAQAILSGTSAFRLDKLGGYLSSSGPEIYFKDGLAVGYEKHDEKRLADELLEEILGVYHPPDIRYKSYGQYLESAFCVPENRARADRIYLSLVQQIARFWGTLLGVRGYARGESFVARNVGLKSFWENGQWNVRIIFMDHDALEIPGPFGEYFYAPRTIPSMAIDERYIWARVTQDQFETSSVGYIQSIYRIGNALDVEGQALALAELTEAYKKTQDALVTNPALRPFFSERFRERLLDWDALVSGYFQNKHTNGKWKKEMDKMLAAKGYQPEAFDSYIAVIEKDRVFLERYCQLFEARKRENQSVPPIVRKAGMA